MLQLQILLQIFSHQHYVYRNWSFVNTDVSQSKISTLLIIMQLFSCYLIKLSELNFHYHMNPMNKIKLFMLSIIITEGTWFCAKGLLFGVCQMKS